MQIGAGQQNSAENRQYLIGLGANLPSPHGPPLATLVAALAALEARNVRVLARSPWFESEPVPRSEQAWFVNAAALVGTLESPHNLLKILHEIEIDFGRARSVPNAARPLDLDLLLGTGLVLDRPPDDGSGGVDLSGRALVLPHPRLAERAFVLRPLAAIAPDWVHPRTGRSLARMAAELPDGPMVRLLGA
ncbi:MAG: 2-amino-4-hydroxy-6-hydroxymethyldihydropteridine diphosphokinase [Reyranellaceae bacterium]